jgi:hypothetical protein
MDNLGKKTFLTQANLRRIVDKFRTQITIEIQVIMANAFKEWAEQVVKLLLLRVDWANWELRGPGFWKLEKGNFKVVQQNLIEDFMWIAQMYHEEVKKLLGWHEDIVQNPQTDMETIA